MCVHPGLQGSGVKCSKDGNTDSLDILDLLHLSTQEHSGLETASLSAHINLNYISYYPSPCIKSSLDKLTEVNGNILFVKFQFMGFDFGRQWFFSFLWKKIGSKIHTSLLTGLLHTIIDLKLLHRLGFFSAGNMFPVANWEISTLKVQLQSED